MRKIIIFLFFIFYSYPCEAEKIFLLHSNDADCMASNLQMQGFLKSVEDQNNLYKVFYMNSTTKRTSDASLKEIARYAHENITNYKPDYLVIFGNIAFKYVTPLLKDFPITFVGITKEVGKYADSFNANGIIEVYDLSLFQEFISDSRLSLWKIYVLYDPSPNSRHVLSEIINEFSKFQIKNYEIVELDTYNEFIKKIIDLNRQKNGILLSCLRTIDNQGIILPEQSIFKDIRKINRSLLEVSTRSYSTHPSIGFAIGISADYYDMGIAAGKIMLKGDLSKIIKSKTMLSINTQRMNELGVIETYKKSNKLFGVIYSYYE